MKKILLGRRRNPKIKLIALFSLSLIVTGVILKTSFSDPVDTFGLNPEIYANLSEEAKTYAEKVSEVLPSKEAQIPGQPYLNPEYLNYLSLPEEEQSKVEIIPAATLVAFDENANLEIEVPKTFSAKTYNLTKNVTSTSENTTIYNSSEDSEKMALTKKVTISSGSTFPAKYDARDVNGYDLTSSIRNQGDLGICWAIASTEVAETLVLNQTLAETGTLPRTNFSLSERQLDFAMATNGINDYKNPYASFIERQVGTGGNFFISTIGMAEGISLVSKNTFGTPANSNAKELQDVLSLGNSEYTVNGTINMPTTKGYRLTGDTTNTQIEIQNLFVKLTKEYLISYGSGYVNTYIDGSCQIATTDGRIVIDHYGCTSASIHAMQIIGWDDEIEYSYCADTLFHQQNTENCEKIVTGKGAWLLQNSWGESSLPYLYLAYDSQNSDIAFITEIEETKNRSWDNNYLVGAGTDTYADFTVALSETNLRGTETLDSIKFITNAMDGDYLITVRENENSMPITKTVHTLMPGLVTVSDLGVNLTESSVITISGENGGKLVDRVGIFTRNQDASPYLTLEKLPSEIKEASTLRLYSETKNLASGNLIEYRLSQTGEDETNLDAYLTVRNNKVAVNNINPEITFSPDLPAGYYTLTAYQNDQILATADFTFGDPTIYETNVPQEENSKPTEPEESNPVYSTSYNAGAGYLKNVAPSTTLDSFVSHFALGRDMNIVTSPSPYQREQQSLTNLAGSNLIGTGSVVHIYHKGSLVQEYTVITPGDVNGDGRISPIDLVMVKQHLLGIATISGPYFEAADVVGDNRAISPSDLVRICQHLLNINPLN